MSLPTCRIGDPEGRATTSGSHVHLTTVRRVRRPAPAPAASPRLRRRPSPWPPHRHAKPATESTTQRWPCTAPRPISTRFEPVPRLRSFTTGSSRIPSDLARRTRPVWQYQAVPALSALLPALPGVSRIGLRSAPARLLRQPGEEVSHLLRFPAPHGAQAPRGAQVLLDGHVAVVKGQLAGPQAAADQEVVARGGNAQPRPRVPAVPFRSPPGGADLPAARVLQQPRDGLRQAG